MCEQLPNLAILAVVKNIVPKSTADILWTWWCCGFKIVTFFGYILWDSQIGCFRSTDQKIVHRSIRKRSEINIILILNYTFYGTGMFFTS